MADLDVVFSWAFGVDATTGYTTSAVATDPTDGNLLVVALTTHFYQSSDPTLSAGGLTWTLRDSANVAGERSMIFIFTATVSGSPTGMTLSPSWVTTSASSVNYIEIENGDETTGSYVHSAYTSGNAKDWNLNWTRSADTRLLSVIASAKAFVSGDQDVGTFGGGVISPGSSTTAVAATFAYHTLATGGTYAAGWDSSSFYSRTRITACDFDVASGPSPQSIAVGAAAESETATTVGVVPGTATITVGAAAESETAVAVAADLSGTAQSVTVGAASETETAVSVGPVPDAVSVPVGAATETETAQTVAVVQPGAPQTVAVGPASETETANAVTYSDMAGGWWTRDPVAFDKVPAESTSTPW